MYRRLYNGEVRITSGRKEIKKGYVREKTTKLSLDTKEWNGDSMEEKLGGRDRGDEENWR